MPVYSLGLLEVIYPCHRCGITFYSKNELTDHQYDSRGNKHHICRACALDFATAEQLKEHYVKSPRHPFCQWCDRHFRSLIDLEDHNDAAHYWCSTCEKLFLSSRALTEHYVQSPRHPFCQYCDRHFREFEDLEYHDDIAHYRCSSCEQVFQSAQALKEHFVQTPRHAYCQRCDKHYSSRKDLHDHYRSYHYVCDICEQVLDFEVGLHEHRRQKHPDRYCIPCKQIFRNRNDLDAHRRSRKHQGQTVVCPGKACGRAFVSYAALILHFESGTCPSHITRAMLDPPGTMWATDRSWNGYAFECYLCHCTYRTLDSLNQHLRSPAHTEKLYRCPVDGHGCGAEFGTLSALWQHMESERCGVSRFRSKMETMVEDSLVGKMRLLKAS